MAEDGNLSASQEDYLEAIFNIIADKGGVRAKDIAKSLGVKAGSVTIALKSLAKSGHINYRPYEVITLTEKGLAQAREIIRKHDALSGFFTDVLGADAEVAEEAACRIEHVIPERLINRLTAFTEFVRKCPQCGCHVLDRFGKQFEAKRK